MNAAPPPTHHTLAHTSSAHYQPTSERFRYVRRRVLSAIHSEHHASYEACHSDSRVGGGLGSARYCRGLAGADRVHGCHVCDDAAVAFFDLARPVAGGGAGVLPGDVLAGQRVR